MSKKGGNKKYGLLQEKKGEVMKWSRVNVDLWGPKVLTMAVKMNIGHPVSESNYCTSR
jgi:hypothetical protein